MLFLLACAQVLLWTYDWFCGDVSQVEEVVRPRGAVRVGDGEVEGRSGHHVARLLQLSGREAHTRDESAAPILHRAMSSFRLRYRVADVDLLADQRGLVEDRGELLALFDHDVFVHRPPGKKTKKTKKKTHPTMLNT